MNDNQTNPVDDDLQRAIDNITNNTNGDPVFSDPVAAPSSVPEGDTGELGEPIGPFPGSKLEVVPPAPEPIAPLESMNNIPDLEAFSNNAPMPPVPPVPGMPETMPTINPANNTPTTTGVMPEATPSAAPGAIPNSMPMPEPSLEPTPEVTPAPAELTPAPEPTPEPTINPSSEPAPTVQNTQSTDISEIKRAALKELAPLLDKVSLDGLDDADKFGLYQEAFDESRDDSLLAPALQAARGIEDDTERAEALLYLVKSID